jgi:Fe-Mn family superoxide dismutase
MIAMASALLLSPSALHLGFSTTRSLRSSVQMATSGEERLLQRFGLPAEPSAVTRRTALALGAATCASASFPRESFAQDGMFAVPPLPYAYDALEPHIDAATMKFHHDFHHQAYVNNANKAMAGKDTVPIASLMKGAKEAKFNNAGGGHYNHCLFWSILGPKAGGAPTGTLATKIDEAFGSFDDFKSAFATSAAGVFGSGWAWLAVAKDGSVSIVTSPNQDNPLMDSDLIPILGIDVWEHAYYLKYQNRRPEYIAAFWNVVNWSKVGEYYDSYGSKGVAVPF